MMSLLSELQKRKAKLKHTDTIVTCADGQKFIEKKIENNFELTACGQNTYGFVLDTKPDDVPAEIIDHLFIGSQDCTADRVLLQYKIKYILSLGISVETKNVNTKFVECLDLPETDIKPTLSECLPFINEAIKSHENVLVHCNAGVSRTSMVAIAYLMQYCNMTYNESYNLVKSKRPAIQPNVGFRKKLSVMRPGNIL